MPYVLHVCGMDRVLATRASGRMDVGAPRLAHHFPPPAKLLEPVTDYRRHFKFAVHSRYTANFLIMLTENAGINSVKSTCKSEHENKTTRCARDVQKVDLVGAYRHPDKNSDDISVCGFNLKELAAVLVCVRNWRSNQKRKLVAKVKREKTDQFLNCAAKIYNTRAPVLRRSKTLLK